MTEQERALGAPAAGSAVPDVDEEGYPSDAALARIRDWPWKDLRGLMVFVRSVWWYPDWGWTEGVEEGSPTFAISTGGWSGNEEVIDALERNTMFWLLCWRLSRRGGHYEFSLPEIRDEPQVSAPKATQKALEVPTLPPPSDSKG